MCWNIVALLYLWPLGITEHLDLSSANGFDSHQFDPIKLGPLQRSEPRASYAASAVLFCPVRRVGLVETFVVIAASD